MSGTSVHFRCRCGWIEDDERNIRDHISTAHGAGSPDREYRRVNVSAPPAPDEQRERSALEAEFAAALEASRTFGQVQALRGTADLAREGVEALDKEITRTPASFGTDRTRGQREAFQAVLDWAEGEIARLDP